MKTILGLCLNKKNSIFMFYLIENIQNTEGVPFQ
jgi:hypothetical protein